MACKSCGGIREEFKEGVQQKSVPKVLRAVRDATKLNTYKLVLGEDAAVAKFEAERKGVK